MEKELLFALIFIGIVLLLMRPRNYRRWTGWLGRRGKSQGVAELKIRQHPVRADATRLSDPDVAARLEKALSATPMGAAINEALLVRIAGELNAYRLSPWNSRKLVWVDGLSAPAAADLAHAMAALELADVPIVSLKETEPNGGIPEDSSRWICVIPGDAPVSMLRERPEFRKALVFLLGPEPQGHGITAEHWSASGDA